MERSTFSANILNTTRLRGLFWPRPADYHFPTVYSYHFCPKSANYTDTNLFLGLLFCHTGLYVCLLLAPYCFNHSHFVIYLPSGIMMPPTFFFIKIVMTKSLFCPVPVSSFFHSIVIPLTCIFICSSSHSTC